jgi:ATP synthase protein I
MGGDKNRLNELKKKIEEAKLKNQDKGLNNIQSSPIGKAMKLAVEIVAALAIGITIGLLIDNFFDTRPLFIIIFFLLGSCAGILNVFRVAKSMQNN